MRALGVIVAMVAVADASPRRTTEAVTLRQKPGEREAVVAKLPANTEVTVLGESGRWLKVRAPSGAVGYVTRTTITDPSVTKLAPTGAWSSARHPDGREIDALFVEVTVPTSALHAQPTPTSAKVGDVAKGAHLAVIDGESPGWVHARDDQGNEGYIARADVDNGASNVTVTGVDLQGTGMSRDAFVRPAPRALTIRADLGIGYRSLGMDLTSNADGGLTNYLVAADAFATNLDVDAILRRSERWFFAGDARFALGTSSPGIDYPGPTATPGKIPFDTFGADVGVRAGVHAHRALDLAVRVGGHYDAFLPKNIDNVGRLPRESLTGATLGARAELVPMGSRVSASVHLDVLAIGARAQTPGLEDGTNSSAHAVWGGATVRYFVSRHVSPFAGYEFERATTSWSGMSTREPGVTRAHRIDTVQLLQIGVSAEL